METEDMHFKGVHVGKIIETDEDLMEHSYPLAGKPTKDTKSAQKAKAEAEAKAAADAQAELDAEAAKTAQAELDAAAQAAADAEMSAQSATDSTEVVEETPAVDLAVPVEGASADPAASGKGKKAKKSAQEQ